MEFTVNQEKAYYISPPEWAYGVKYDADNEMFIFVLKVKGEFVQPLPNGFQSIDSALLLQPEAGVDTESRYVFFDLAAEKLFRQATLELQKKLKKDKDKTK